MPIEWKLYDYVGDSGDNEIASWSKSLQKIEKAKLNAKLDMLRRVGMALHGSILAGPLPNEQGSAEPIYKLKIHGKVQLRPMLCRGPIDTDCEFTLLLGATEVGDKLDPPNAVSVAAQRRERILRDNNRRCPHERTT
jgi:hypothetical protein